MTEIESILPDHRLTTVRHYEAGPPEGLELVEPGETFATTKEEEWVSKKKTEVLNTKQIETRVKRQVVLEDGKVVEDSGPMVSTNTTEDTETQEHHQTELRKLGDDGVDGPAALEEGNGSKKLDRSDWIAVPNPDGVVREVKERRVVSREETEEVKETEDVQHLGDITDEEFLSAVRSGKGDLREVLRSSEAGRTVVSTGPRLVHESTKSNKVTDTEDTRELSSVRPDGKIVTETQRTTEHEEVKDDELPEDAPERDYHKESSERYLKTREQEDVDYLADGVNVGHEMRFKTETMEVERRGDGLDEPDWDSLSARARRRASNKAPHRYRGPENGTPLDRKDAVTKKPLDFDQEEETRKSETSKWLENHFGSDSRSSNNSEIDNEEPPRTSFFNVTIKSQPSPDYIVDNHHLPSFVTTVNSAPNSNHHGVYAPVEPERDTRNHNGHYKGISDWSERRQEHHFSSDRRSPLPAYVQERRSPGERLERRSPVERQRSPVPDYRIPPEKPEYRIPPEKPEYRIAPEKPEYRIAPEKPDRLDRYDGADTPERYERYNRTERQDRYEYHDRIERSPRDTPQRASPLRNFSPTPPQRKRQDRTSPRRIPIEEPGSRYSSYRGSGRTERRRDEPLEEPPPDYSPPSPPPMPVDKKPLQKTRFADNPPKAKSGNIIGQSIRKLVGKIRSASAERKARQRAKRSPSPSYQPGHVIDGNIGQHPHVMENGVRQPVQRYYLGEDPFGGSIYGKENKYDGVKPARSSRRPREEEKRSQSTLGRFSKSTGRLVNGSSEEHRSSQTLPRHLKHQAPTRLRDDGQINVSIINTVSSSRPFKNEGPAKPARTYKSTLLRSKSFNIHSDHANGSADMYKSNPHLHRLEDNPIGLKSPGLISSLNRSGRDVSTDEAYTCRFVKNGHGDGFDGRRHLGPPKDAFKTVLGAENGHRRSQNSYSSLARNSSRNYNGDIYEPPTRLRDSHAVSASPVAQGSVTRRGSSSSTDFSETYHTTTRNDNPLRPSVTNTVKSFSKKTVPSKDGRTLETIESSETKSVTKSHFNSSSGNPSVRYYENDRRYNAGTSPVVIEVRNNYRK